jgi:hypothetical protein
LEVFCLKKGACQVRNGFSVCMAGLKEREFGVIVLVLPGVGFRNFVFLCFIVDVSPEGDGLSDLLVGLRGRAPGFIGLVLPGVRV